MEFSHFNKEERAKMVDVSAKDPTLRIAKAYGEVLLNKETLAKVKEGRIAKGDVLAVAQVAGIMAAKRNHELIPMCHNIPLESCDISFAIDENASKIAITSFVKCHHKTGVEMEALMAVSIAALTIYDMCKALQKDIEITNICLLEKRGGKSDYVKV